MVSRLILEKAGLREMPLEGDLRELARARTEAELLTTRLGKRQLRLHKRLRRLEGRSYQKMLEEENLLGRSLENLRSIQHLGVESRKRGRREEGCGRGNGSEFLGLI